MTKKILTTLAIISVLSLPLSAQVIDGKGQGKNRPGKRFGGGMDQLLLSLPSQHVGPNEQKGLNLMREEEKLARDVYQSLYDTWKLRIFRNISQSEQRHMDAIKVLLDKYSLPDPITQDIPGVFTDGELQQLYNDLTTAGKVSVEAALRVGAIIEDLDIADLKKLLKKTNNSDIKTAYQNLMKGSRNHIRAFISQMTRYELSYKARYLSQTELDAILESPHEKGLLDENGDPLYGNIGW